MKKRTLFRVLCMTALLTIMVSSTTAVLAQEPDGQWQGELPEDTQFQEFIQQIPLITDLDALPTTAEEMVDFLNHDPRFEPLSFHVLTELPKSEGFEPALTFETVDEFADYLFASKQVQIPVDIETVSVQDIRWDDGARENQPQAIPVFGPLTKQIFKRLRYWCPALYPIHPLSTYCNVEMYLKVDEIGYTIHELNGVDSYVQWNFLAPWQQGLVSDPRFISHAYPPDGLFLYDSEIVFDIRGRYILGIEIGGFTIGTVVPGTWSVSYDNYTDSGYISVTTGWNTWIPFIP